MSKFFNSLLTQAEEQLVQAEADPNINRALLNSAQMAVHSAEQLLTHHPDCAKDKTLHAAFKSHLDQARKALQMAYAEPALSAGQRVQGGGRKGNLTTFGTREYREALWAEYQETVNELANTTNLNWTGIKAEAATRHGVCERTIQRNCKNPRN